MPVAKDKNKRKFVDVDEDQDDEDRVEVTLHETTMLVDEDGDDDFFDPEA